MATNFPASLDTLTNPTSSDSLSSPSHSAQHANVNDAIEALQAKVGVDSSAVTSSLDYKIAQLEAAATGKILQVVSTTKTDTFSASVAAGADTAVTGLSATITPSSSSSKILVMVNVAGGRTVDAPRLGVRLFRGATEIGSGASASNRSQVLTGFYLNTLSQGIDVASATYLDSPATTSSTTYSVNVVNLHASTTLTLYVNRSDADTDDAASLRTSSTITLMEVAA